MPFAGTVSTASFDADLRDRQPVYEYAVAGHETEPSKTPRNGGHSRGSHGGTTYQRLRPPDEGDGLWQVSRLEETGTLVSAVFDLAERRVSTVLAFSRGPWDRPGDAHGDKRNPEDLARRRRLTQIGSQADRVVLVEQAAIVEGFRGTGDLEPIRMD